MRRAFELLVELFDADERFRVDVGGAKDGASGKVEVRFYREDDQCFAFIPNAGSLLFYIRKPELKHGRITLDYVRAVFPEAETNRAKGEITVRLFTEEDARRMFDLIASAG